MDSSEKFELTSLPVEKEFLIASVRHRLKELSREEVEVFLAEALDTMTRLAHQVTQLKDYILELEGKIE